MNADQLAQWRNYHQLTQTQLAAMLGVHQVTVARWEIGTRHIPSHLGLSLETIQRELPKRHKKIIRYAHPKSPGMTELSIWVWLVLVSIPVALGGEWIWKWIQRHWL